MALKDVSCKTAIIAIFTVAVALGQLTGCSGGGGDSTPATGTLKMSITDAQSDDFSEVVVAIREVRVVPAGKENAADNDPGLPVLARFTTPLVIDVMKLQFVQQALGELILPAGSYSQVRLILEPNPNGQGQTPANYVIFKSDLATKVPLKTPSGQQSGLKVLGPIEVKPNVINAVTIDFDPNTAIVVRGNNDLILKPTGIRMVQTSESLSQFGSIAGTVSSTFKDWSSATIAIKRRGAINDSNPIAAGRVFSNYTSGRWQAPFAAFVPSSTQNVSYKAFIAANGFQLYSSQAVTVVQGASTSIGQVTLAP